MTAPLLNLTATDKLIEAIDSAETPVELQALANRSTEALAPVKAGINAQIEKYAPLVALATPPDSPAAAVTWITNFINDYLQQMIAPALTLPLQSAELIAKQAEVVAAVERANQRIPNCNVTVPPL